MGKLNGTENGELAAVYVPWGTFHNFIDGMTEGLPNVIDRSLFEKMAGGMQSGMMSGLKFMGLIDEDGRPTAALEKLTTKSESAEGRKAVLAEILNRKYAALISIGLDKASMKQLLDTLESSYRVSGETREKAARFFISAAQYAGIPLSRYITDGGVSIGRRKTAAAKRAASAPPPAPVENGGPPVVPPVVPLPAHLQSVGEQRTFALASGGTLTLSTSVGFMKLAKSDRDFVAALIDQIDAYEADNNDNNDADADDQP